jgi:hypothetical protein
MKEWNYSPRIVAKKKSGRFLKKKAREARKSYLWPEYHG